MADTSQHARPSAQGPSPDADEAPQAKRSRLMQAAGAPSVGPRGAQPNPDALARRRRLLVGLALSAVVVVATMVLVMALAADISL